MSSFRVILNDDFDSHARFEPELFDLVAETAVTTFSLCVGADVANYPSRVRTTLADNLRQARDDGRLPESHWSFWYEFLVVEQRDPIAMAIRECRRCGLEFFASLRINDIHHGKNPEDPHLRLMISPFWRDHPELRARGWERAPEPKEPRVYPDVEPERWDRRAWASYSFEHAAVRQRVLAVVEEIATEYDIDGFDLDFSRAPPFFDRDRGRDDAHHMTDLVRETRAILDRASARRGRRILLAAPCRPTVAKSAAAGLDVAAWIREGLVDILMPGQDNGSGTDCRLDEFLALSATADTEICPFVDNVARPGGGANVYTTPAVLRAAALHCHAGGAQGMQLFNFFAFNEPGHFETQLFREGVFTQLGERARLEQHDKHCIYRQGLPVPLTGGRVSASCADNGVYGDYWLRLPLDWRLPPPILGRSDRGRAEFEFRIADALATAWSGTRLPKLRLTFSIVHADPADEFRFRINGELIPADAMSVLARGRDLPKAFRFLPPILDWVADLTHLAAVRSGRNTLEIETVRLGPAEAANAAFRGLDAQLYDVELSVRYR